MEVSPSYQQLRITSIIRILTPLYLLVSVILIASSIFENQIVTFVSSLFPAEADKGYVFYKDFVHLCLGEMVWISGFATLVCVMYFLNDSFRFTSVIERWAVANLARLRFITGLSVFTVTVLTAHYVLEKFPNSADEYSYIYQAETLSKGELWQEAPVLQECFHYNHIVQKDGLRVGRFPPGWPLILSSAFILGIPPHLINPLIGLLTLIVFFYFVRLVYDVRTAWWSLTAFAFSSFFIFNSASYFSHSTCLLFTLLFVYCIHQHAKEKSAWMAITAGFCLGMVVIIRYYTAVLIFLPFLFYFIYHRRLKSLPTLFYLGVGSLPCVFFLAWYNYAITGNALLPVTVWAYEDEALGFVRGHTPIIGLEHMVRRLFMFIYWSSPGLLVLYILFLVKKVKDKTLAVTQPEDYLFIMLLAGYFFYYQIGGNQYGPRFLFEAFPFLCAFVAHNVLQSKSKIFYSIFFASIIYAVIKFPFIAEREGEIVDQRQDVYDLVKHNEIKDAVILVTSATSPARPMPVGDLIRNDSHLSNDVIYAHYCPEYNEQLMQQFNNRSFYKYVRNPNNPNGLLLRVK